MTIRGEDFLKKTVIRILLIIIIGVLVYSNTFEVPFILDDENNITNNPAIKGFHYFSDTSLIDKAAVNSNVKIHFKNRLISYLTFALNYKLHRLNVTGYHIINLAIHIINAILVYFLVVLTFKTPYFSPPFNSTLAKGGYRGVALFSALLFVSHPIQTQAVTYISQRFASLATLFYLLSVVSYVKWRLKIEQQTSRAADHQEKRKNYCTVALLLYCASLISAILAMKAKEIAFTLPLIIAIYEFMFFEGKIKKRIIYLIPIIVTMFIIPVTLIIQKSTLYEAAKIASPKDVSRWDYFYTQFRAVVTYIRLLFLPINQNLDYNYPLYSSFFHPKVILSFLFLLSFFFIGIYLFYRSRYNPPSPPFNSPLSKGGYRGIKRGLGFSGFRLISFGILWFFITLSVESSILPLADVIFEQRLYLPSVGFLIAFISVLLALKDIFRNRMPFIEKAILSALVFMVIGLSVTAYARNTLWQDKVRLWKDVVKKSYGKSRPHNNLGSLYLKQGHIDEALVEFQTAIKLDPNNPEAHNNLGNVYHTLGSIDDAIQEFQTALRINPDYADAHNNLGNIYSDNGRIKEAIWEYQTALSLNPESADIHYNLGNAYFSQDKIEEAGREYQIALMSDPENADIHYNLGNVYFSQDKIEEAAKEYRIVLRFNPDNADAHNNLGNVYSKQSRIEEAIWEYQTALRLSPDNADAHNNLGNIYLRRGLLEEAIKEYKSALRLKPNDADVRSNLEILNKAIKSERQR